MPSITVRRMKVGYSDAGQNIAWVEEVHNWPMSLCMTFKRQFPDNVVKIETETRSFTKSAGVPWDEIRLAAREKKQQLSNERIERMKEAWPKPATPTSTTLQGLINEELANA